MKAGPGRPKGRQNNVTLSVKQALMQCFEERGSVKALLEWSNENPDAFYAIWGRLAPKEVNASVSDVKLTPEERKKRVAAILGVE